MNRESLHGRLAVGWNTWDVRSVLGHVLLPQGVGLRLALKEYADGAVLAEALAGRHGEKVESVRLRERSFDGSYTRAEVSWRGFSLRVESTTGQGGELVVLLTPLEVPRRLTLAVGLSIRWGKPGGVERTASGALVARTPGGDWPLHVDGRPGSDLNIGLGEAYVAVEMSAAPVAVSVGAAVGVEEARAMMGAARERLRLQTSTFHENAEHAELYGAVRAGLSWDTIYDPDHARVITPVSRVWSSNQGGWVLFCWDTFFAAQMAAAVGQKDLAYANALEILSCATPEGFVPNTTNAHGFVSRDRSQPPVGSMAVLDLVRKWGDRELAASAFEPLLRWNRWWRRARRTRSGGLLAWGSQPYPEVTGNEWETAANGVGGHYGAAMESGLDNSPMYDGVPMDPQRNMMCLEDVGLNALFAADCEALAEIGALLGRSDEVRELSECAAAQRSLLGGLWNEQLGVFCNRRTDTGELSPRVSPTCFYPMLAGAATAVQCRRMWDEHLGLPSRLGGEWMLPSISRDDPAYPDQNYWRGRIWAPLNFLVWRGLRRSGLKAEARVLAQSSARLLLGEWRAHGHIHENYHGDTGLGCGYRWSDSFYHWGALLALPLLAEAT